MCGQFGPRPTRTAFDAIGRADTLYDTLMSMDDSHWRTFRSVRPFSQVFLEKYQMSNGLNDRSDLRTSARIGNSDAGGG